MVVYLSNLTRTQISIAEAWSGDGAFLVNIQKDVEIPWILYENDLEMVD